VSPCTVWMLSRRVVATNHLSGKLAHAHLPHSELGSPPCRWTLQQLPSTGFRLYYYHTDHLLVGGLYNSFLPQAFVCITIIQITSLSVDYTTASFHMLSLVLLSYTLDAISAWYTLLRTAWKQTKRKRIQTCLRTTTTYGRGILMEVRLQYVTLGTTWKYLS